MTTNKRMRYFEDFTVGETFSLPPVRLEAEDGMVFAARFEGGWPVSEHMESCGLSPWHVATVVWGKWVDTKTDAGGMVAGMGIDHARWFRPVMPGEALRGQVRITDKRVFYSGDAGSVSFELQVLGEDEACVLKMDLTAKMRLRTPQAPSDSSSTSSSRPSEDDGERLAVWHPAPFVLTDEEIIAFGEAYDDRPIHVDHAQAAQSPFGELISSGLHSMAHLLGLWRKVMINEARLPLYDCLPEILEAGWLAPVLANAPIVPILELTKEETTPEGERYAYFTNRLEDAEGKALLVCRMRVRERE